MKLNCLGDMCPVPLLKADAAMKGLPENGSLMVVTDHSCTVESLQDHFPPHAYTLEIEEPINGVWEVTILKKPTLPQGGSKEPGLHVRYLKGFRTMRNPFSKSS